ncbi:MAG: SDR family oxidoreductase [Atribacterota bacterium]|jgi:3-oxoacyl-[acyl-carrier protein] reductase|nr:SDR family oxidoreductase [Atribacterota bacterium]
MSNISGKVGIVTGGTSGFGLAITRHLLYKGAKVSIFSVDDLRNESVVSLVNQYKGRVMVNNLDITEKNSSELMVQKTITRFGKLNFLIVNAGFAIRFEKPFPDLSNNQLYESLEIQFKLFPIALATLAHAASVYLIEEYKNPKRDKNGHLMESGSIIVTLSEAALLPLRDDLIAYAAAKKAALSVMQTLSGIFGEKNIRVNGIAPGFANTAGPKKFYSRYPQIKDYIDSKTHLKPSFMSPESIIPAVEYLMNDNYVTGQVITLDGGFSNEIQSYFQKSSIFNRETKNSI